jgi:hypothetical protein
MLTQGQILMADVWRHNEAASITVRDNIIFSYLLQPYCGQCYKTFYGRYWRNSVQIIKKYATSGVITAVKSL